MWPPEDGLSAFRFLVSGLLCSLPSGDRRACGDSKIPSKVLQEPKGKLVWLGGKLPAAERGSGVACMGNFRSLDRRNSTSGCNTRWIEMTICQLTQLTHSLQSACWTA